ncbi:MAG TPA: beta-propeller fold lactonase family protein [Solirubrobacteraceae bacterium]
MLASIAIALLALCAVAPSRASAAVESGALSQLGEPFACIGEVEEGVAKCGKSVPSGLSYAYDVQVSPDGRSAYSVAVQGDLIEYSRNPANGSLSVIGCFSSKPKTEPACETNAEMEVASIESPAALAISPDGSSVYVIGQGAANDLVEFSRNAETGLLTKVGCITEEATSTECTTGAKGLELPYGVTVSPDGENVYVTSFADQAIAEFKRDTKTGLLTQLSGENDCVSDTSGSGCGTTTAIGLKEAIGVAVSPDGKDVYTGAGATSAEGDIAAFERGAEGALKQLHLEEGCISETVIGCSHAEHIQGTEDLAVSRRQQRVWNLDGDPFGSRVEAHGYRCPRTARGSQRVCYHRKIRRRMHRSQGNREPGWRGRKSRWIQRLRVEQVHKQKRGGRIRARVRRRTHSARR